MKFDAEAYTISVRKENHDGDIYYVGRVEEFPNISTYEDTPETARALVVDAIETLKKLADETQSDFPAPYPAPSDEFNGRVTLRLPKTLHAKVSRRAVIENTSVNQLLVTAVASYIGEIDGISKVVSLASKKFLHIFAFANDAITPAYHWKQASVEQDEASMKKYIRMQTNDPLTPFIKIENNLRENT